MLSGPAWSGSIQQDLIEKLWVAILTCDADDATAVRKSLDDEAKKKDDDQSDESSSSSSSSSDDNDSDIDDDFGDLGAVGDSLPQVNRFDLFSVAKLKQNQQKECSAESQDVNGNFKDAEKENEDEADKTDKIASEKPKEVESPDSGQPAAGHPGNVSPKVSPPASGAKPKVIQSKSHHSIVTESQRPRPNTLSLSKPQNTGKKLSHSSSFSFPSRYSSGNKTRGTQEKVGNVSHFVRPGNCKDRKSPVGVPKQSPSKIPTSPQRPHKVFPSQDRANLLDVVPRRRLMSDPRPSSHGTNASRSFPVVWHRKAVTPDASRPYPLHRNESFKREAKNGDATLKQKQSFRGNLRRWNTSTSTSSSTGRDARPSSVFVSPSRGEEARGTANCLKSPQKTGEKLEKQKSLLSPDVSSPNRRRGSAVQPCKPNGVTSTFPSPRTNIKSPNKETQRIAGIPSSSQRKSTPMKVNTKGPEPTKLSGGKGNAHLLKGARGKRDETEAEIPDKNSEEEEEVNNADGADPDLHERTIYGNEAEVTRLENCLKEAILGVLQGLPEGWILVPEHTAELFSSLSSVVDSFPRPNHARARVLEAIVDAHARRPCDKGEIAALNNAHLLLYVGLKLCSRFSAHKATNEIAPEGGRESLKPPTEGDGLQLPSETKEPRKSPAGSHGNDGEIKDSGNENASGKGATSCDKEENVKSGDVTPELEQKGIALKILGEILKCEGSFDRLMMCLLLGSRAPGRGSGWYCETEDENEKVEDLRFVLDHLKFVEGCRVSEVVNTPLWSCGSSPVVLAALAESPRLVLALLQYGAGGGPANLYLYSRCYTNGVYLAIAYLVRKLESQFREETTEEGNAPGAEGEEAGEQAPPEAGRQIEEGRPGGQGNIADVQEKEMAQREKGASDKRDLLKLAGPTPTALCLRYLLRAVPRVPIKFLRDQLSGCSKDRWQDVAYLLPHPCCLQPPSLLHLSRAACRQHFRNQDLLPQVIDDLNIPETLREYLNLLRD
ncbi:uncharacterized protein [Macrobrachium rosenbergii]|uniref:uncharacterized protein n=1 Tax=Macrobrachium rosenbergii TaxID=79674 RepID=UPI0034D57C1A